MHPKTLTSMRVTLLEKLAKTRAAKEVQRLMASGDAAGAGGTADEIARGYSQLGLSPRYVGDVSTGGAEAAVDLMMGAPKGGRRAESGWIARKLYKPHSTITTGRNTSDLLAMKQNVTDAAQSVAPGLMPEMYWHETLDTPRGLRHTSQHEYVPGVRQLADTDRAIPEVKRSLELVRRATGTGVYDAVVPVHRTIADVHNLPRTIEGVNPLQRAAGFVNAINPGNLVTDSAGRSRVLDFLPAPVSPLGNNPLRNEMRDVAGRQGANVRQVGLDIFKDNIARARRGEKPVVPSDLNARLLAALQPVGQVDDLSEGLEGLRRNVFQGASHAVPATPAPSMALRVGGLLQRALRR